MSKTNVFETGILKLIFQNDDTTTCLTAIGDGLQASATAGSLYISLHTANPNETGDQTTSEADYGGYARVAVNRTSSDWTSSGNSIYNQNAITFPICASGTNLITHYGIGTDSSGS
jgi:hypothetical protein